MKNATDNEVQMIDDLLDFLTHAVTPFHAVELMTQQLDNAGFTVLQDSKTWQLEPGGQYYTTRNDSSIIAFKTGTDLDSGLRMVGAHTDSPCLKLKPQPDVRKQDYWQLGVEVYGGALLSPWFDRDLSIAGRVSGITKDGQRFDELINFVRPIACIPSLAIHFDRDANQSRSINAQQHLPLLIATEPASQEDFKSLLLEQCQTTDAERILDFELSCYDTQAASIIGLNNEFIASARLDNLLSSFIGLQALLQSDGASTSLFVSNDHEEVGSASACGAQGPFLQSVLERILPDHISLTELVQNSELISVDNAHAVHPNYRDKHDAEHGPLLNAGPVIKVNANQRYASNSVTSANFRHLCEQQDIPVQTFVMRSDLACGSTIGPITASELGVATLDIGIPQLAMHSIRELAGVSDCHSMLKALTQFLNR